MRRVQEVLLLQRQRVRLDRLLELLRIDDPLIILELIVLQDPEDLVREAHHVEDFVAKFVVEANAVVAQVNSEQVLTLRQGDVGNGQYLLAAEVHARQVDVI